MRIWHFWTFWSNIAISWQKLLIDLSICKSGVCSPIDFLKLHFRLLFICNRMYVHTHTDPPATDWRQQLESICWKLALLYIKFDIHKMTCIFILIWNYGSSSYSTNTFYSLACWTCFYLHVNFDKPRPIQPISSQASRFFLPPLTLLRFTPSPSLNRARWFMYMDTSTYLYIWTPFHGLYLDGHQHELSIPIPTAMIESSFSSWIPNLIFNAPSSMPLYLWLLNHQHLVRPTSCPPVNTPYRCWDCILSVMSYLYIMQHTYISTLSHIVYSFNTVGRLFSYSKCF